MKTFLFRRILDCIRSVPLTYGDYGLFMEEQEKGNNGHYLNATLSRLLVYKSRVEYVTLLVLLWEFQVLWLK